MSALFLIPFCLFVLTFYKLNFTDAALLRLYDIKNIIKDYLVVETQHCCVSTWIFIFCLTSVIFLPAIITNPQSVKNLIINESSSRAIVENHNVFFGFNVIWAYLSDSFVLSFNLFVIIIFLSFLLLIIWRIKNRIKINKEILTLAFYFFSFFVFIALFSKIYSFRYLTPILLVFQIIAGAGIYEFSNVIIEKWKVKNKNTVYLWAVVLILISQGLLIYYSEIERIESLPYFG
jgi:hypothetical protein